MLQSGGFGSWEARRLRSSWCCPPAAAVGAGPREPVGSLPCPPAVLELHLQAGCAGLGTYESYRVKAGLTRSRRTGSGRGTARGQRKTGQIVFAVNIMAIKNS